jgi:hypothetical protein
VGHQRGHLQQAVLIDLVHPHECERFERADDRLRVTRPDRGERAPLRVHDQRVLVGEGDLGRAADERDAGEELGDRVILGRRLDPSPQVRRLQGVPG